MTKKVEEFLIEKKENLQELMSIISNKTREVASKIESTAKNSTAKVAEFIEDNKFTAKRIATGIGATAIVATSTMGLAGCDELQPGGLAGELLEQHTENDTAGEVMTDENGNVVITYEFTYEECAELFYKMFYEKYPEFLEQDYQLELVTLRYNEFEDIQFCVSMIYFYTNNRDEQSIYISDIPINLEQYYTIKNSLPDESITLISGSGLGFAAILDKIPLETKTELCNYIANQMIKEHPELLEDESEMEQ